MTDRPPASPLPTPRFIGYGKLMHAAVIRKKQQAHPFVPFDILLPGEQRVHVPHPDYLFISPSGRYVEVWDENDDETTLTTTLILGLKECHKAGRRARK